jgi:hypothetical protein
VIDKRLLQLRKVYAGGGRPILIEVNARRSFSGDRRQWQPELILLNMPPVGA